MPDTLTQVLTLLEKSPDVSAQAARQMLQKAIESCEARIEYLYEKCNLSNSIDHIAKLARQIADERTKLAVLHEKAEQNFTAETFHALYKACLTVYKEKPGVESFNDYVIGLVEKDLGHKLEESK